MSELPSKPQMVKNFAGAVTRRVEQAAKGEKVRASREERDIRWREGCLKCSELVNGTRCKLCGCHMEKKVNWASERCRAGKWMEHHPGKVTVIIPYVEGEKYLDRTVEQIQKAATGSVEMRPMRDTGIGKRATVNQVAGDCDGEFLMVLDAHVKMSPGWDEYMKRACGPLDLVVNRLDALDEEKWMGKGHDYGSVYLNRNLVEKWWHPHRKEQEAEPTMGMTGCGWMIRKSRYWQLGGMNEELGKWGAEGPEMTLKVWLSGGSCYVHRDVICYHLFRDNPPHDTTGAQVDEAYRKLRNIFYNNQGPRQIHPVSWLVGKFWPVPSWQEGTLGPCVEENRDTETHETVEQRVLYHGGPGVLNIDDDPTQPNRAIVDWREEARLEEVQVFRDTDPQILHQVGA